VVKHPDQNGAGALSCTLNSVPPRATTRRTIADRPSACPKNASPRFENAASTLPKHNTSFDPRVQFPQSASTNRQETHQPLPHAPLSSKGTHWQFAYESMRTPYSMRSRSGKCAVRIRRKGDIGNYLCRGQPLQITSPSGPTSTA